MELGTEGQNMEEVCALKKKNEEIKWRGANRHETEDAWLDEGLMRRLRVGNDAENLTKKEKDRINKRAKDYKWDGNNLWHVGRPGIGSNEGKENMVWKLVPPPALRKDLIEQVHNNVRHLGFSRSIFATLEHLRVTHKWHGMRAQIESVIRGRSASGMLKTGPGLVFEPQESEEEKNKEEKPEQGGRALLLAAQKVEEEEEEARRKKLIASEAMMEVAIDKVTDMEQAEKEMKGEEGEKMESKDGNGGRGEWKGEENEEEQEEGVVSESKQEEEEREMEQEKEKREIGGERKEAMGDENVDGDKEVEDHFEEAIPEAQEEEKRLQKEKKATKRLERKRKAYSGEEMADGEEEQVKSSQKGEGKIHRHLMKGRSSSPI